MRNESKNEGERLVDRAFNDGMQDKDISAGAGFAHFHGRDAG